MKAGIGTMIYFYAIFFGCGAMFLLRFLWINYASLVLGSESMTALLSQDISLALWTFTYMSLALLIVLAASVPAAKERDASLAAINGALIGAIVGLALSAVVWLRGTEIYLLDIVRIGTVPVGLSLLIAMIGFGGAMLYRVDDGDMADYGHGSEAANDNVDAQGSQLAA